MKNGKRIHSVTVKHLVDSDPDTSYLEQEGFEDRLAQFRNDEFSFVGIIAEAEVDIKGQSNSNFYIVQRISSGGLWGIESDSDKAYLAEIAQEQLMELRDQLKALGFSARAISVAFKTAVTK